MRTHGSWRSRHPMLANVLAMAIAAWLVGFGAYGVLRDDWWSPFRQGMATATITIFKAPRPG